MPQSVPPLIASWADKQEYPSACLYVVATPIGNLADISIRAWYVLSLVDVVACEDTRHTAILLRHLGLHLPLISLHAHNEYEATLGILDRLAQLQRVAYVSDAGTPTVSDPGTHLVATVRSQGYRVMPIPGPSSILTALCAAGIKTEGSSTGFRFVGFLPAPKQLRQQALEACISSCETQVLFEAPHRIQKLAQQLAQYCPMREVSLCRELTKCFESIDTMQAIQLPNWLAHSSQRCKGEFVVVVHAISNSNVRFQTTQDDHVLQILLRDLPLRHAVDLATEITGLGRKGLYARALELQHSMSRKTNS